LMIKSTPWRIKVSLILESLECLYHGLMNVPVNQ
jgi:hypothetical protein